MQKPTDNVHFMTGNTVVAAGVWELVGSYNLTGSGTGGGGDLRYKRIEAGNGINSIRLVSGGSGLSDTTTTIISTSVNYLYRVVADNTSSTSCYSINVPTKNIDLFVDLGTAKISTVDFSNADDVYVGLPVHYYDSGTRSMNVKIYKQALNVSPTMAPTSPTQNGTLQSNLTSLKEVA